MLQYVKMENLVPDHLREVLHKLVHVGASPDTISLVLGVNLELVQQVVAKDPNRAARMIQEFNEKSSEFRCGLSQRLMVTPVMTLDESYYEQSNLRADQLLSSKPSIPSLKLKTKIKEFSIKTLKRLETYLKLSNLPDVILQIAAECLSVLSFEADIETAVRVLSAIDERAVANLSGKLKDLVSVQDLLSLTDRISKELPSQALCLLKLIMLESSSQGTFEEAFKRFIGMLSQAVLTADAVDLAEMVSTHLDSSQFGQMNHALAAHRRGREIEVRLQELRLKEAYLRLKEEEQISEVIGEPLSFIYSYQVFSRSLYRTNLLTGEVSCHRLPPYSFLASSNFSELLSGNLFVTGGSPAVKDVVRIDTLREFAVLQQPPMLTARYYHAVVLHAKHLYVLGGYTGSVYLNDCERFVWAESPHKYRQGSDTAHAPLSKSSKLALCQRVTAASFYPESRWEALPPLPTVCGLTSGFVVEGSLYALGGYTGVYQMNSIMRLSFEELAWELLQLTLPAANFAIPCFKLKDSKVYFLLNQTLYSFTPLQVVALRTFSTGISSWHGTSHYCRGTLYCSSSNGAASKLEIGSLR
jgi:hypothetical protein